MSVLLCVGRFVPHAFVMIDDVKLIAIQKQLERIERGQFLLACMIAMIGLCWAITKLFPFVIGPILTS